MGAELPMFTAFVARMADPDVHLAAYGSVVFPISLVVEGPVIMLLAASTALSTDWASYCKVRRYMWVMAGVLTLVHAAIAFTPLYDWVARDLIGAPDEVIEPGRIGLRIMTPWTGAIAYRRFQQGVLIRAEQSRTVMAGTMMRLLVLTAVLAIGYALELGAGIVIGATAVATAVTVEAFFVAWVVRPVIEERVKPAPPREDPITRGSFLRFYVPLAMTPLLTLLIQPAGAAAMSRMPFALESLAAWPAVHGLVFLTRSAGFAYNEVVVALLGEAGAAAALRRFAGILAGCTMIVLLLLAGTPLSEVWFGSVSGLSENLVAICSTALLFAVLMPGYQAFQSWYQGVLVHRHRTRGITEAVALYLVVSLVGLTLAVNFGEARGIYLALCAFTAGGLTQTAWLSWRCRRPLREMS